jgi:hypothetical protein
MECSYYRCLKGLAELVSYSIEVRLEFGLSDCSLDDSAKDVPDSF